MNTAPTEITPTEALYSGVEIEVTYETGEKETVRARVRKVREYEKASKFIADEAKLTDWFFDKPQGWSLSLYPSSYTLAVTESHRVNADFLESALRTLGNNSRLMKLTNPEAYRAILTEAGAAGTSSPSHRSPR